MLNASVIKSNPPPEVPTITLTPIIELPIAAFITAISFSSSTTFTPSLDASSLSMGVAGVIG